MSLSLTHPKQSASRQELNDLLRGVAGAFLFGLPLLMTMEVWWIGEILLPLQALMWLGVAFVINLGLAHMSGMKEDDHGGFASTLQQTFETLALGIFCSVITLLALNRINSGDTITAVMGQIAIEAVPLSIGAAIARSFFAKSGRTGDSDDQGIRGLLKDMGATAAGSLFLSFSIAPTQEIPTISSALSPLYLLVVMALSLFISYIIVFESGISSNSRIGYFQAPFSETVLSYLISLAVCAIVLLLFGQISFSDPFSSVLGKIIVLALPATIGGAGGRLVV